MEATYLETLGTRTSLCEETLRTQTVGNEAVYGGAQTLGFTAQQTES